MKNLIVVLVLFSSISIACDQRCQYEIRRQAYMEAQQAEQQRTNIINAMGSVLEYERDMQRQRHESQMNINENQNLDAGRWYQNQNLGGY